MTNQVFNLAELRKGFDVTLASGRGYHVDAIACIPFDNLEDKTYHAVYLAYIEKDTGEKNTIRIGVNHDGFYVDHELTKQDIVRVRNSKGQSFPTQAGLITLTEDKHLDVIAKNHNLQNFKVKTRSGFWFNVASAIKMPSGYYLLNLVEVTQQAKQTTLIVRNNGVTQKAFESKRNNCFYYDPMNIVDIALN